MTKDRARSMMRSAMEWRHQEAERDDRQKARDLARQFDNVMKHENVDVDGMAYIGATILSRAVIRTFEPCSCGECGEGRIPFDDAIDMLVLAMDDVELEEVKALGRA